MSVYKDAFQARWHAWEERIEYDVFDAVDDWLINGHRERKVCIKATVRLSNADVFFMLADALTPPTEEEVGEGDAEQFSGTC